MIVVDDLVIHFKKKIAPFSGAFITVRDNKCNFHIIIVKSKRVYAKVEIAVINKGYILERFVIEFKGVLEFLALL